MSVKILGGALKGLTLAVPAGMTIRPTSILLRRRLFDWRQNLEGYDFFDLCAGTGAMGLEAFSRGAASVVLVEKNKKIASLLQKNLQKARDLNGPGENFAVVYHQMAAQQFLQQSWESENSILYLDPPYEETEIYFAVLKQLSSWYQGEVWVESDRQKGVNEGQLSPFLASVRPSFVQGSSFVYIGKFANTQKEV